MHRPATLFAIALLFFLAAVTLFTRENRFPFYYHPDESGKVEQIRSARWNFNHPMLLLTTARQAALWTGALEQEKNSQRLVEIGRTVSATFTAGAVAFLVAGVWLLFGPLAAGLAGVLLLFNHQLFELAHYFKEDTALLFGLSVWFFALILHERRRAGWSVALIGVGSALAASGKTMGLFTLPISLLLACLMVRPGRRWQAVAAVLVPFILVAVAVNFPALQEWGAAKKSFDRELNLAVGGQGGLTRSVPHTVYLSALRDNVFLLLWAGMGWFYFDRCWRERRSLGWAEWTFALFPLIYLVILSFAPKTNDRYFLPATALFLCLAAAGVARAVERWRPRLSPAAFRWGVVGLFLLAAGMQFLYKGVGRYYRAFQVDDTAELVEWLNANLPEARLAIDRRVMLAHPGRKKFLDYLPTVKAEVLEKRLEYFDGFEELQREGVTHVILSESTYGRYRLRSLRPKADGQAEYDRRRDFYETLLSRDPIWKRDRGTVIYLHPGLEVYALPPLPDRKG